MLPLGDASRRTRSFPIATVLIIVLNLAVFALELDGGDAFILRWSLVPADIVAGRHLETILSSMFLHEGWEHILGNMLFLWAFGPEIEDSMGTGRYLVFYLLGGLAATFAQIFVDPASTVPSLGASGAIAAVMGAFLVTYPRDRIRTVLFFGWFFRVTFVPAIVLVGFWFVSQLFSEVGSVMTAGAAAGGVAYMAHIGGFVFGAIVARAFETSERVTASGRGGRLSSPRTDRAGSFLGRSLRSAVALAQIHPNRPTTAHPVGVDRDATLDGDCVREATREAPDGTGGL